MKRCVIIFFLSFLGSTVLYGQYGKIAGKITDEETKEPLVGANISLEGTAIGASTDLDGSFTILNVPAGTYDIRASYIGYQTKTLTGVKVVGGITRSVEFALSNTSVQVQSITIVAERPLIEKSAANAVRTQVSEELEKLPLRGVQGYFSIQPGVVVQNGTVYMRGSRNEETGYQIEGADTRDVVGTTVRANISGNLITTIPEALEEVSVQSGGFGAEFGGASAGIVAQTFKTAGSDLKIVLQAETDNFGNYPGKKFLGTYSYGYSDYVLTVGTPLFGEKIKVFGAFENQFARDQNNIWFYEGANFGYLYDNGTSGGQAGDSALMNWENGNVRGRINNRYSVNGTVLLDFKPLQVRLASAFTWSKNSNNNQQRYMFCLDRYPVADNTNFLFNGKVNYALSKNSIAEASINYVDQRQKGYDPTFKDNLIQYQDSIAAAAYGWQYATLTSPPQNYNFNGFVFYRPGYPVVTNFAQSYNKDQNQKLEGSVALTSIMGKHEFKMGSSYQYWTISHFDLDPTTIYTNVLTNPDLARDPVLFARMLRANSQVNNYGFDEFGNPMSSGLDGPKHPTFLSAYIQDRLELSDLIITAGLRADVMDIKGWSASNIADFGYDAQNYTFDNPTTGKAFSYLEPRLGFSFPASDRTVFHLQYGKYVEAPPLYNMYRGRAATVYIFQNTRYFTNVVGYNIEPSRTTQYEVGFSQQFSDVSAFDITGFYKDITGQLQMVWNAQPTNSTTPSHYAYANGDFQSVMGMELSLRIRRIHRIQAQLNYTLQDSRGTNSFANSAAGLLNVTGGEVMPSQVVPLDFSQTHRGSISLDYRWGKGEGGAVLSDLGFNLLFTFNSGHPYTHSTGTGGQQGTDLGAILNDADSRSRFPLEPINNSVTPWVYQLDLRVDKSFSVGSVNFNVYVYVQNLLNTKNVTNVYYRTGNAYDDGWLSDPVASANTVSTYGATYQQLYEVMNLANNQNQFRQNGYVNFGIPRILRVGAKIEL
ncbi:MAG: TonB-dependent receptor [Ignavibacteriales bacterium]|nr:TonB-dependent receptor [Ignavibacteriales bacterium]